MKKTILLISMFTGLLVLSSSKKQELNNQFVKIDNNLLVATYETTNSEYWNFINDLKSKNEISLLTKCLPDSTQWKIQFGNSYNEPMSKLYNWHPAYLKYPVVNITKEAMELYCDWKSEKYNSNSESSFKKVVFRLPTVEEWIKFSSPKLGSTLPWNGEVPYLDSKKGGYLPLANLKIMDYSTNSYNYVFDGALHTSTVGKYKSNELGIYDIIGNVSEMTNDGVIKGGSWSNTIEESKITNNQEFQLPNPCVGFRIVMEVIEE